MSHINKGIGKMIRLEIAGLIVQVNISIKLLHENMYNFLYKGSRESDIYWEVRFDDKYQFISFIGIDSVTSQSGVSAYHGPIYKTGCKFGRTILFNIVTTVLQISAHTDKTNPIYLFFRKKQSEGKHHYKCIIACETKLCKIIYKLCSSNCLYENK